MNHTYPNFTLINGYKWSTPIAVGLRPRNSAQRSLQPARRAPLGFSAHGPASGKDGEDSWFENNPKALPESMNYCQVS